ncbi:MAG: hypothetical protein OXH51_02895 [Gemmatimonadetes bacterium]|nr:hypothetical protein [Gemmatimonadota bacterium]
MSSTPTFTHVENLIRQESKALRNEMRQSFEALRKNDLTHIEGRLGSVEGRLGSVEGKIDLLLKHFGLREG